MESWPYEGLPAWVFSSRDATGDRGRGHPLREAVRWAPHHAEMAAAAGDRNVWVVGGGHLAQQFADEGLLDELILTVVPVVLRLRPADLRRAPG